MKTRPDSLIQLKSGRDSHWCFRIRQLFCHTSGSEHRHLKPDCAVSLQNDSLVLAQLTFFFHRVFFISLFSYFHALLQFIRAVHSLLLAKQGSVKRVTLVYLPLPRKSLEHWQQIVDCRVRLCTSLRTVAEFLTQYSAYVLQLQR